MFVSHLNPVLLNLGPLQIRWYGLFYAIGFLFAYYLIAWLAKRRKVANLDKAAVDDLILYLVLGVVLGARFFHVFVFNASYYFAHPSEIIAVWQGGLSFHGGLVGGVVACWLFCRRKKVDFLKLADIVVIPLAAGLGLGRIGNFINGELYGKITTLPWAVKFPGVEGFRHPTQIYESLKNFVIFGTLLSLKDTKWKKGTLFCIFLFMYGVLRFTLEFMRDVDPRYYGVTEGQIFCAVMAVFAVVFYFGYIKRQKV